MVYINMFILACAWHKKLHSGFQITNYLCVAPSEEGKVPPSASASTILISTFFHYLQFTCWYICLPPFSVSLPCAFCSSCIYSQDFSLLSLLINSFIMPIGSHFTTDNSYPCFCHGWYLFAGTCLHLPCWQQNKHFPKMFFSFIHFAFCLLLP